MKLDLLIRLYVCAEFHTQDTGGLDMAHTLRALDWDG